MKGRTIPWIEGLRSELVLLAPLIAAVVFVLKFAGALPLTDEWNYTHAIRALDGVDLWSRAGLAEAVRLYPMRHGEHLVGVPFLVYWPLAEWTHFDSRWIIGLTVAGFTAQMLIFRRWVVRSALAMLPIALVMFCPSHFMEFLWGWQFTVTLS